MVKAPALFASILVLGACAAAEPVVPEQPAAPAPPAVVAEPAAPLASAPPAPTSASASATPAAAPPEAEDIEYPFRGLATLPDDCKEPSVVLTTAPTNRGWDYDWTWTRQAMFANQQFKIVDWPAKPTAAMQVRFDVYEIAGGFALVGVCKDGATCNKLAAMYKSVVPTCKPTLQCGAQPMSGKPRASRLVPSDGGWLPKTDVIGQCARIGVCMSVKHQKAGKNPGVACQNAPATFKTECAKLATCDEVVACLHG